MSAAEKEVATEYAATLRALENLREEGCGKLSLKRVRFVIFAMMWSPELARVVEDAADVAITTLEREGSVDESGF